MDVPDYDRDDSPQDLAIAAGYLRPGPWRHVHLRRRAQAEKRQRHWQSETAKLQPAYPEDDESDDDTPNTSRVEKARPQQAGPKPSNAQHLAEANQSALVGE
eukprot:SAG31_NODE_33355_length_344_cov_1.877551_1_plen_101_part_01